MEKENNGRLLPNNADVQEVRPAKPRRSRSKFVVSTARREILGDHLQLTEVSPNLQGFFYGDGAPDEEEEDGSEDDEYLPLKNYGRFARLPGTTKPVDPSLSLLSKALPENRHIFLVDACNGLLLLGHIPESDDDAWPEFAVCNPATQQWVHVPSCVDWVDFDVGTHQWNFTVQTHISLLFDPAVSSHFRVLIFWNCHLIDGDNQRTTTVHAYSSETGLWRNSESDWTPEERQGPLELWRRQTSIDRFVLRGSPGAFVDGMLYLNLAWCQRIIQVDMEGKTQGMFPVPAYKADPSNHLVFVGRSQGRLHCIVEEGHGDRPGQVLNSRYRKKWVSHGLYIWALADMDRQEWVLKHKVSRRRLFGEWMRYYNGFHDYRVITMHPDCNMVFFKLRYGAKRPMISYDFSHQEVRVVETYQHHPTDKIIPFDPYLSELFLGVLGAHKY